MKVKLDFLIQKERFDTIMSLDFANILKKRLLYEKHFYYRYTLTKFKHGVCI